MSDSLNAGSLSQCFKPSIRRPLTPYLLFCGDKRQEVANCGVKGKSLLKEFAKQWKELDEESKRPYLIAGEMEKTRFEEEKQANLGGETRKKRVRLEGEEGKRGEVRKKGRRKTSSG